jgi:hypothetical protein
MVSCSLLSPDDVFHGITTRKKWWLNRVFSQQKVNINQQKYDLITNTDCCKGDKVVIQWHNICIYIYNRNNLLENDHALKVKWLILPTIVLIYTEATAIFGTRKHPNHSIMPHSGLATQLRYPPVIKRDNSKRWFQRSFNGVLICFDMC